MATIAPILTADSAWQPKPGNGLCVFFFDSSYEFYPAGIGNALGYCNYTGPVAFNSTTLGSGDSAADINALRGAYAGVGFDIDGNFSNTSNNKTGRDIKSSTTTAICSVSTTYVNPNSICVRYGELSSYQVHSFTPNLSTFPLGGAPEYFDNEKYIDSPPVTLHQYVTSQDDITFHSVKVTLQNNGSVIRVDIKNPSDGKYYPYHIANLDNGGMGSGAHPSSVRTGIAFATSDNVANCEIKNFTAYGKFDQYNKLNVIPSISARFASQYI